MHYQTLNHTLAASQQEVTNYVSQTEQLNSQITLLEGQFAAVVTAKDTALQQIDHLSATIEDYDHKVQGLEAQKDQLEQDKYSTQTALTELQAQHETVRNFTVNSHFLLKSWTYYNSGTLLYPGV